MRSEDFISPTAPASISVDFVGNEEDYDYAQIGKGVVHAFVIPLILYFVHPQLTLGYVFAASILYGTIFRHKSDGFFGVLVFMISITALMIVA